MSWAFARPADLPLLMDFLRPREWECVSLTGRLRSGIGRGLPGGVAINVREGRIRQAAYLSRGGLLIPCLPGCQDPADWDPAGLRDLFHEAGGAAACLMGMEEYLEPFLAALGLRPGTRISYHMMTLPCPENPLPPPPPEEFRVRTATGDDLERLLPLQERYEKEEVLLRPELFDPALTRAELRRALKTQILVLAEHRGRAVAKGGTNARGMGYDQIGGVFTLPDFRGRGDALRVMERLLYLIFQGGKGACLFVKRSNLPAIGLYRKIGFGIAGNFGIHYF